MLGIPMGSRKLEDLEQRPSNEPFIKEWEEQFKHVPKPIPAAIASVISDTTEALLYLDSTIFPDLRVLCHIPALRRWKTTTMKKRIKMETKTRCLGKLEHHGEFDPEEEQYRMNVYKGLNVYVPLINDKEPETKEEYYEKIVLKFDIISNERSELVKTLKNGVKKFEDDHIMIDFCKQYGELFNDNEFNLYVSSKDDDSEGEPDEDNESNNHDDDGALTTDTNKQKESDNQKKEQNKEEIDNQTEESGSEGTKESGSEGTKENGSEGKEGGSDGKEEKMNGDDKEVIVQIDIDNQNEELNKEKDANETEDNDNVNNNEMKNDSVQEKQDVDKDENVEKEKVKTEKGKQDKADKVDKVQEKQDNDKKEMGEDEFWNTQFTDSHDFIFETKEGNATIRDYMQTLAPTLKIESNVIDTYCLVLNHKQGMNHKEKKTKHFFHIGMITKDMFKWKKEDGKKYDEVKQYKAFFDTMKNEFKKDDELKKMKDLEMKNMFSMHLKEVQHPRAKEVLNKKPTILRPKCGTEENNTDCGVFLMMHMENYNGENARNWNLEFKTEKEGNRYDIIKMRMRFAIKILSHEINIHREEMSKQALEFADRNKEKKAREVLIREAIRVKKERKESERVQSVI
ncbi:ulp1 protease family, C-terminal catalytic domain-containing protein [Tanacetum coccineum]